MNSTFWAQVAANICKRRAVLWRNPSGNRGCAFLKLGDKNTDALWETETVMLNVLCGNSSGQRSFAHSKVEDRSSDASCRAGSVNLASCMLQLPHLLPLLNLSLVKAMSALASHRKPAAVTQPGMDTAMLILERRDSDNGCFNSVAAFDGNLSTAGSVAVVEKGYINRVQKTLNCMPASKSELLVSPNSSHVCERVGIELLVSKTVSVLKANKEQSSIASLLLQLRQYDGPLKSDALLPLLHASLSNGGQLQVVMEVMDTLSSRKVQMADAVSLVLRDLCDDDKLHEAFEVLKRAADVSRENPKLYPFNAWMANTVLSSCVMISDNATFYKVLDLMDAHGVKPNTRTRCEIIKMAGIDKDLRKVRAKWAKVSTSQKQQRPKDLVVLHSARVYALARADAFWEALLALEELKPALAKASGDDENADYMKYYPGGKRWRDEQKLDWGHSMIGQLKRVYHELITAAARNGYTTLVKELLLERKELGWAPYSLTREYNMLLEAAASAGNLEEAKKWTELMRKENTPIQVSSYSALVASLCDVDNLSVSDNLSLALDILKENLDRELVRQALLGTIIHTAFRKRSLEHLQSAIEMMAQGELLSRSPGMYAAVFTYIGMTMTTGVNSEDEVARLRKVWRRMKAQGMRHSQTSVQAQVWALGQGGDIPTMLGIIRHRWKRQDQHGWPQLNLLTYNTALHACRRHAKFAEMHEIIEMVRRDPNLTKVPPKGRLRDQFAYGDDDLTGALQILNALRGSGKSPGLFTFNFLIQVVSHAGHLGDAVSLLARMQAEGMRPDSQTLKTLLFYAAHHGRFDVLEYVVRRTLREGFALDFDICTAVISPYVKSGRCEDAVLVLKAMRDGLPSAEASASRDDGPRLRRRDAYKDDKGSLVTSIKQLMKLVGRTNKD